MSQHFFWKEDECKKSYEENRMEKTKMVCGDTEE
jgi:hypothetical protein